MDLNKITQLAQHLDSIDPDNFQNIIQQIREFYRTTTDLQPLGTAVQRLAYHIITMKDPPNTHVPFLEQIIHDLLVTSIRSSLNIGFDAMRYIFDFNNSFYKSAHLDPNLDFPIGVERPLANYTPEIGETCDVIKPYITSTSFCVWTRCAVLAYENGKYTVQYENTESPATIRENPHFAPLGSRTPNHDWRTNLKIGTPIDALRNRVWYKSTIAELITQQNGIKQVRVTFRRFSEEGDRIDSDGNKYFGLGINEDEVIQIYSVRIQPSGSMSNKKLCYYTASCEQPLPDDTYEILFVKQYEEKPFHAIMRTIYTRSLSYLSFVNTFISNGGLEVVLNKMDNPSFIDPIFDLFISIGNMSYFFPKMDLFRYEHFYHRVYQFYRDQVKNLNQVRIDMAFFCIDCLGRRLYSLTEVYDHQKDLREFLIVQFLQANMEKQMLALRYLYELINPTKKQYSEQEKENVDIFLRKNKIFNQLFQSSVHEQILSRSINFLRYLLQRAIVGSEEIQSLWNSVPLTDQRGRSTIEKLLAEVSKDLPMKIVEQILNKLLSLKETQLTMDNLNLLRELKNRELSAEYEKKMLAYLWETATEKTSSLKENIEEEVEKVFKVFVAGIKDPAIRSKVLQSMLARLEQKRVLTNQLDFLKDFLLSYPDKLPMIIEETDAPLTIGEAISYIKRRKIYEKVLKLFQQAKNEELIKEFLDFLGFLFEHDDEEISQILQTIYVKLGPSETFLRWIHKISKRTSMFVTEILNSTHDLTPFENITPAGFEALRDMIFDINQKENKIRILKSYKTSSKGTEVGTITNEPDKNKKDKKDVEIGPQLPQEMISHLFVLVSPSKIQGTIFLQKLLPVLKNSRVYDEVIKLLIKFVVSLDESIEHKTEEYRKDFLDEIMRTISSIVDEKVVNDQIKTTLQAYLQLVVEIFAETQRQGLGNLKPHFEQVEGEILTLKVENKYENNKSFQTFQLKLNENTTVWKLKTIMAGIIGEDVSTIAVIKFADPMNDSLNAKSLSQLFFYNGQSIKVTKKQPKDIPKYSLFTENGEQLSPKFVTIINKWFNEFKEGQDSLTVEGLKKLSQTHWKGSLFREPQRLTKTMEQFDTEKKGYLSLNDFKNFFYVKGTKNPHGIWKIIHLAGYLNNLKQQSDQKTDITVEWLPRRILSSSSTYQIIFKILENKDFEGVHLNFYRLLTLLEVDEESKKEIKENANDIIKNNPSLYRVCYTLEVLNAQLSKKDDFFFKFYQDKGLQLLQSRLLQFLEEKNSIYALDSQTKNALLPNIIKIFNMYLVPFYCHIDTVRFLSRHRLNVMDLEQLVKKQKEDKQPEGYFNELKTIQNKLKQIDVLFEGEKWYKIINSLLHNMMKNYSTDSTDFVPKLTGEVVRCTITLVLGTQLFKPTELIYGLKNESLNYRRGAANITYLFMQNHEEYIEEVLLQILKEMPTESKHIFSNYFSLLAHMVGSYSEKAPAEKDEFLINLANELLDKLFLTLAGEQRISLTSDKVIVGILMTVEMLLKRKSVCIALVRRKKQIVEKCLFFYGAKEKLQKVVVTKEVLAESKQPDHFENYVICKTEDARKNIYRIVELLHEISRQEDPNFLQEFVLPVIQELPMQAKKNQAKSLKVGLNNFGSTCYMNSMLQIMNSVAPFRNLLMQASVQSPLVEELKQLFSYLFFSERIDYAPKKLLEAFVPPINPGIQQDTTEFLNFLFDQLESALAGSSHRKLLDEIFKGANAAQMICHSCGAKRQNREQFFCYSVEIDGKYDLQSALEGAHQGEVISDFFCESCNNRGETTKRNILNQIPSVFFVHLRRIVFNYDMFVNMKIHTRLQFPQELNIEPFTKEGVELRQSLGLEYMKNLKHNEEEKKKFQEQTLHGKDKDYYKMKLKGVIVHSGSADVGHYYAIVPNNAANGWLKLDDARTTVFPISGFESECFGGTWTAEEWGGFGSSKNAYVLIYEKVLKNEIRLFDEKTEETRCIKYDEVQTFNTVQRYKEVWLDNHQFLVQSHLLEGGNGKRFMQFVCEILSHSKTGNQMKTVCEILYRICMFSGHVGDLGKIFQANIGQINQDILHNYILADKQKTFKVLFHYQKQVRDLASSLIHGSLVKCYRDGDEKIKTEVVEYIKELLSLLPGEVAKNWLRIDGYFKLFFRLLASSVEFLQLYQFFINLNLISVMIDFIMEKNSPVRINPKKHSIGTKTNPADFRYGLEIISFLLRRSFGLTGVNYEVPAVPEFYLFHLSDNDVACLSCLSFYEKMMSESQNLETLGTIIQRLCIKNIKFSKVMMRIILSTVTSITDFKDEMKDISSVIQSVLIINDGFWRERAEALLGIASPYILQDNSLSTLDEEKFIFTSTLYDIFPIECLLAYIYIYRLKNPLGCFQLLKGVVRGCSISTEGMYYLVRQPSPSYYFASYFEWASDFASNFINFVTIDDKRREQLKLQIQEVNRYLKDIADFIDKNSKQNFYKSVITGAIIEKKVVQTIFAEEEKVQVIVEEYEVYSLESQPTGKGNKSLDHLLDGGRITKNIADSSSLLKIMKKPKKSLALKMKPVEEDEDKELIGLFETETQVQKKVNAETTTAMNTPVVIDSPAQAQSKQKKKEEADEKKEEEKQKQKEKQEEKQKEDEEIIEVDGIFKSKYYRQIQIKNKSKTSKFVKIRFDEQENANTLLPQSLSFKVGFKNSQKIFFNRQAHDQPWPDFKFTLQIQDFEKERKDEQWYKIYGGERPQFEDGKVMIAEQREEEKKEAEKEKEKGKEKEDQVEMINCPFCTFINPGGAVDCEVCGNPLKQ